MSTEVRIALPVLRASYARWRQLREQYRRGLVPSDSGTGIFWQCSHSLRPSLSRGTSYFVMTQTVSQGGRWPSGPYRLFTTGTKSHTLDMNLTKASRGDGHARRDR